MSSGSNFTANKRKFVLRVTKTVELLLEHVVEARSLNEFKQGLGNLWRISSSLAFESDSLGMTASSGCP